MKVKVSVTVHILFYKQCDKHRYYGTASLVGYFVSTIYIKHFLKQIVQLNITMTQCETGVKGIQRWSTYCLSNIHVELFISSKCAHCNDPLGFVDKY